MRASAERRHRCEKINVKVILERCISTQTGTDGFRALCHQFFPSCLSRRESCLTSSKTFSLKMNKLRGALLLSYNIGGQCMASHHRDPISSHRHLMTEPASQQRGGYGHDEGKQKS